MVLVKEQIRAHRAIFRISRTNVASVGSVFNDTREVKVLSLPETIKEKSTFRAKALRRELVVGGRGKPRVFLYELITFICHVMFLY